MSSQKSLLAEYAQVQLAIELIELGARLQVVESETDIGKKKLIKLYKEIKGESPPRGMLPFATDWYLTWKPNIHSSLFYNIYLCILSGGKIASRTEAFIKAFRIYKSQVVICDGEFSLGITRAWTLIRFFESDMLELNQCVSCTGKFVAHAYTPCKDFVCGLCLPPSRAGKGGKKQKLSNEDLLQ